VLRLILMVTKYLFVVLWPSFLLIILQRGL
jgi:hypothetical protein